MQRKEGWFFREKVQSKKQKFKFRCKGSVLYGFLRSRFALASICPKRLVSTKFKRNECPTNFAAFSTSIVPVRTLAIASGNTANHFKSFSLSNEYLSFLPYTLQTVMTSKTFNKEGTTTPIVWVWPRYNHAHISKDRNMIIKFNIDIV